MNPKYYVTPDETQRVVDLLNKYSIGGGVEGVAPNRWEGPFSIPEGKGKEVLNVVLKSGVVMSAGLTLDLMSKGYPEAFVASMLRAMAAPPQVRED